MVALALFLTSTDSPYMAKRARSHKKSVPELENLCSYCLFFQPYPGGARTHQGNCAYHKEWIENASLTTCSDMSSQPLKEKGIYRLVTDGTDSWSYVRRQGKLRTRLFLIKGFKGYKKAEGLKGLKVTGLK